MVSTFNFWIKSLKLLNNLLGVSIGRVSGSRGPKTKNPIEFRGILEAPISDISGVGFFGAGFRVTRFSEYFFSLFWTAKSKTKNMQIKNTKLPKD